MALAGDISGFAVIAGTRIILPVEVASIDATVELPVVGTVGTILSGNISATLSGNLPATGTIGTIQSGNVTASISGGAVDAIGTVVSDRGATASIHAATVFSTLVSTLLASFADRREFTLTMEAPGTLNVAFAGTVTIQQGVRITGEGQTFSDSVYTGVVTGILVGGTAGSVVVGIQEVRP